MPSAESLSPLEEAFQADYLTVIQHVCYPGSPSNPGFSGPVDWRYNVLPGMVEVTPQESAPPGHSTAYSFLAPDVAKIVVSYPLEENTRQERIVVNRGGQQEVLEDTARNRRKLRKRGIEILPLVVPLPGQCNLAEAI
jgi:hypothetical protein